MSHKSFSRTSGMQTPCASPSRGEEAPRPGAPHPPGPAQPAPVPPLCPAPASPCPLPPAPSPLNSAPRGVTASRAPSERIGRGGAQQQGSEPLGPHPPPTHPKQPVRPLSFRGSPTEPRQADLAPGRPAGGAHQGAEILPAEVRLPQSHSRLVPRHLGPSRK